MTTEVTDIGVGTIRTGIIGGGFMGGVHAAAVRAARGRIVGIATSHRESAERARHRWGVERAEADADALVAAADIDVVHICTPNATHASLALAALEAGKHVVCEKPLATNALAARALVDAATARGVVAAVPFVYRYHPMVREARARVATGGIGAPVALDCAYLQDWMLSADDENWRAEADQGGPSRAFADIGSHLCDLIEFVAGDRIARVTARTRRVHAQRGGRAVENEDLAAVMVETRAGALGTLLVSQMAPGRKNALSLELHGTKRSLRFDQERPEELWVGDRSGSRLLLRDPDTAAPDAARLQRVPAGHPMGYQDAFDNFVADVHAAVGGQTPEGLPTFADGLRAVVLTEAVLESARSGVWVEVPE